MDNVSYHSVVRNRAPTSTSKVSEIKLWLSEDDILVPFSDTTRDCNPENRIRQSGESGVNIHLPDPAPIHRIR